MQLEHSFTVPVGVDEAWSVLLDIERIAPCMPGAALDTIDGDDFTGTVKVKLGPISLTYKGKASFVEKDAAAHRAVIDARGRDARGNGTAAAKVTATLSEQPDGTKVDVLTDLDITGKPAQFGRGVMVDVGNKLIGQFADCLAGKLSGGPEPEPEPAPVPGPVLAQPAAGSHEPAPVSPAPTEAAGEAPATPPAASTVKIVGAGTAAATNGSTGPRKVAAPASEVAPIDLLEHAGPAVAKRLVPAVLGVVAIVLVVLRLRRRHPSD